MDGSFINELKKMILENQTIEKDGDIFSRHDYHPVRKVDRAQTITLNTLEGLANIVRDRFGEVDIKEKDAPFAVIETIQTNRGAALTVKFYTSPHPVDGKYTLAYEVVDTSTPFEFGKFFDLETFNTHLQTRFVADEARSNLFSITSRIDIDEGVTQSDDGSTMRVTTRKGLSAASAVSQTISSSYTLRPLRTFIETDQPSSAFNLRIRDAGNKTAEIALFETDGGKWIVEAKRNIAKALASYGFVYSIYY